MKRIILLAIWIGVCEGTSQANEVALFETASAVGSFISFDAPCVTTTTSVFASKHIVRFDDTLTAGAFVTVHRRDHCEGVDLIDAVGAPVFAANEFIVSKNLKGASLAAIVTVHDFVSGAMLPLRMNLRWSGTSRLIRSWTISSDDFVFIVAKEATKTYLATASGEIALAGENFTPNPSQNAAVSGDENMFVIRR